MFQDVMNAGILAIIEGITEFLPISSTGHLIIAEHWFSLQGDKTFQDTFLVVIQFPAILAVLLYFYKTLLPPVRDVEKVKEWVFLWVKICVAFIPAGVLGFFFDDFIDFYLFNPLTVTISLIVGGIVLIWIERLQIGKKDLSSIAEVSIYFCIAVGLFQCIAMIPGVSRSAATIIGSMLLGVTRSVAVEFSFYLAIPTLAGASGLKLLKHGFSFSSEEWLLLLIGSIISFIVAYLVIALFLRYVKSHDFRVFGIYRIALGVLVIILLYLL
ncbi:MAG: undecaprenyl-diphosphate phosphatase [Candidatus Hydrogenedens sp.]|nr:undecaprenyl-diphosphate phosphatase [Candidatus Hydrogenedens sp.]